MNALLFLFQIQTLQVNFITKFKKYAKYKKALKEKNVSMFKQIN